MAMQCKEKVMYLLILLAAVGMIVLSIFAIVTIETSQSDYDPLDTDIKDPDDFLGPHL